MFLAPGTDAGGSMQSLHNVRHNNLQEFGGHIV